MVQRNGAPVTLLVVDDEDRLRQTFVRALTGRGYQVSGAGTYREAMAFVGSQQFDLVLLDINLPDATGWDMLRDLRAAGRSVPVIVTSAVPPRASLLKEFRPAGVLHKPFPIDALFRLIQHILEPVATAENDRERRSQSPDGEFTDG